MGRMQLVEMEKERPLFFSPSLKQKANRTPATKARNECQPPSGPQDWGKHYPFFFLKKMNVGNVTIQNALVPPFCRHFIFSNTQFTKKKPFSEHEDVRARGGPGGGGWGDGGIGIGKTSLKKCFSLHSECARRATRGSFTGDKNICI